MIANAIVVALSIVTILITVFTAVGCQQTPGLGPNEPWLGSELPRASKFRHVGPGTWIVTDGQGNISTMQTPRSHR